jgi:hypothetical protein
MFHQRPTQNYSGDELPERYRYQDTDTVFRIIRTGESMALVGVGSSGKSNFVRHVVRDAVKRINIQDQPPHQIVLVLLNPHYLVHLEDNALQHSGKLWPGYELMLNRLRMALRELEDQPLTPNEQQVLTEVYRTVSDAYYNMFSDVPLKAQAGLRRLEDAVADVMDLGPGWKLAFIFDELEEFVRKLPVEFFQSLRGLRDDNKRRLLYITTSRLAPRDMLKTMPREESLVLEGFTELFHDFTVYLGPLDDPSAHYNLNRYENRYGLALDNLRKEYLLHASGRHIGLMRRGYIPTYQTDINSLSRDQFVDRLLNHDKIQKDCETLFNSLSDIEKQTMTELAFQQRITHDAALNTLYQKHLIDQSCVIRIPLLQAYIRRLANGS